MLIGVTGLIVITYFYTQTERSYAEQGDIQHTISLYAMSLPMRMFLFTIEALGIILGYFAYKGSRAKLGLLGIGLCTLCLVMLYGYTF